MRDHSINGLLDGLDLPDAPSQVTILTGAGVSVEGPTSLPSGGQLIDRIFGELFQREALLKILAAHQLVGWTSVVEGVVTPRPPRLETVLGIAKDVLGVRALGVLDDMIDAPPNRLHRFLHSHLVAGGRQVTANFDTCIERAIGGRVEDVVDRIFHFHLRISADGIPDNLGVTLDRVEHGFEAKDKERFVAALTASKSILVIGYSGSDFFDVDAAINELPVESLSGYQIVWIDHDERVPEIPIELPDEAPRLTRTLREKGADVTYVLGRTDIILGDLATQWKFDALPNPEPSVLKLITLRVSEADREHATFELYRRLGLFAELRSMMASSKLSAVPVSDQWRAEMELLWAEGKYKQAWSRWRREGRQMVPEPERLERLGACLWVQGRLVPAYGWLSWQLRRADDKDRSLFVERLGRVIEKMWLTPELTPLARWATPRVLNRIPAPTQLESMSTYRNLDDLVNSLEAAISKTVRTTEEAKLSQEWFSQAGSVTAVVQFKHRELRDLASMAELPSKDAYLKQIELATKLGSTGDAARVVLIPGAGAVFSLRETLKIVSRVEFGLWQCVRIIGLWIVDHCRRRTG